MSERGSGESAGEEQAPAKRTRRRVTTAPPAGSDPHPEPEPRRHDVRENDDRLTAEMPPHWGKTH